MSQSDWRAGTAPPPGPGLLLRGALGYLHLPDSRVCAGTLGAWTLTRQGHLTIVEGQPVWADAWTAPM